VQFVVPKHFQMMEDMENGYRTHAHASTEDLHVSRTLDQSYYTSLMTTKDRDYDQVIYRYTERKTRIQRKMAENLRSHRGDAFSVSDDCASLLSAEGIHPDNIKGKATPQLMMVHSIWIWKLGGEFLALEFWQSILTLEQTRSLLPFQSGGALAQIHSWTRYCSTQRRLLYRMPSFV
jgi:hypothetical protein